MSNTPETEHFACALQMQSMQNQIEALADILRNTERGLTEAREQRDRLAEAASKLTHYIKKARAGDSPSIHYFIISSIDDAILKMDKALAAVKGGSHE